MAKKIIVKEDRNKDNPQQKVPKCNLRKPPTSTRPHVGPTNCSKMCPPATVQGPATTGPGRIEAAPTTAGLPINKTVHNSSLKTFATKDQNTKMNFTEFDFGLQSLIDNVCLSELNTPDIKILENIDFGEDLRGADVATCGETVSRFDFPVLESSSTEPQAGEEEYAADCTPSPDFYSDSFDRGDNLLDSFEEGRSLVKRESMIHEPIYDTKEFQDNMSIIDEYVQDHNGSGVCSEDQSSYVNISTKDIILSDNQSVAGDNQYFCETDEPIYDHNSKYITPSNDKTGIESLPILNYSTPMNENNLYLTHQPNSYATNEVMSDVHEATSQSYDAGFDLLNINEDCLDSINSMLATQPGGNILSEAFQMIGLENQDTELSATCLDDKINSFLNDTNYEEEKIISSNIQTNKLGRKQKQKQRQQQEQEQQQVQQLVLPSSPKSKLLDTELILKSFESSFGKGAKPRVIKNVQISFPRTRKVNLTSTTPSQSSQHPPQNSEYSIKVLIDEKYLKNNGMRIKPESRLDQTSTSTNTSTLFTHPEAPPRPSTSSTKTTKTPKRKTRLPAKYETMELDEDQYSSDSDSDSDSTPTSSKRGRYTLVGLSDADKYKRIREQNNLASKKCRDKKKRESDQLGRDALVHEEENARLLATSTDLERRVAKWKQIYLHMVAQN